MGKLNQRPALRKSAQINKGQYESLNDSIKRSAVKGKSALKNPMYFNPVGPGDHDLPIYSAADDVKSSEKRNAPKFTMQ